MTGTKARQDEVIVAGVKNRSMGFGDTLRRHERSANCRGGTPVSKPCRASHRSIANSLTFC